MMKQFNCKNSADGKIVVCAPSPKKTTSKAKTVVSQPRNETKKVKAAPRKLVTARKCKPDFQPPLAVESLIVQGKLTAAEIKATSAKIQDVYGCLIRTHTTILGEVRTDLRQQFRTPELVELMNKLVSAYFSDNRQVLLTVPDFSWTGLDRIPSERNLPKKTINVADLTADEFLETVISLGGLIYYNNEDLSRLSTLSSDILNTGFPGQNDQAGATQAGIVATQFILDKIDADELTGQTINRELGLRLMNSYFKTLYNFYANPLYFFNSSFQELYSAVTHKYYNLFFNFDSSSYLSDYMSFHWNVAALQSADPVEYGVKADQIRRLPKLLMSDVRTLKKVIEYERAGINTYFWVKLFVDPVNSRITVDAVDVEGISSSGRFGRGGNRSLPYGSGVP